MSLHVMIDLQCPNNAGGIAALNSHGKSLMQEQCWPWFVANFCKPASNIIFIIIIIIVIIIALGSQFPRAEKLGKLCKKSKLYDVIQCTSVGELLQIVWGRTSMYYYHRSNRSECSA